MDFVGVGILLAGLAWVGLFAFIHFRAVAKAEASETWPTAPGKVLPSRVVEEESRDREGGTSTWYNPAVSYSYAVGGATLQSNRIRFANMRKASRSKAEEIVARYPAGSGITVRYDPEKAAERCSRAGSPVRFTWRWRLLACCSSASACSGAGWLNRRRRALSAPSWTAARNGPPKANRREARSRGKPA